MPRVSELPPSRDVPIGVGFGTPHDELFRATRRLLDDVVAAEERARAHAEGIHEVFGFPNGPQLTPEIELRSGVVQVFAAMAVEAAIDTYAVVRFGEVAARSDAIAGIKPAWRRLQKLLERATGARPENDAEILAIVDRLFKARNAIAHPTSSETRYEKDGTATHALPERFFPGVDGKAARAAFLDVQRFSQLLVDADPEIWGFLHV